MSATNVIFEGAAVETCEVCRGQGSFPMPGLLITGSLRGLLDGPEPGLA